MTLQIIIGLTTVIASFTSAIMVAVGAIKLARPRIELHYGADPDVVVAASGSPKVKRRAWDLIRRGSAIFTATIVLSLISIILTET